MFEPLKDRIEVVEVSTNRPGAEREVADEDHAAGRGPSQGPGVNA